MKRFGFLLAILLATLSPALAQDDNTLTLVTYDSFAMSEDVQAAFEEEVGVTLEIVRLSDAGAMVNQVILTRDNPLGDVLYGVDNTFLSRALDEDLFVPYESPELENVPDNFKLDPEFRVTPVDYGDVCINYDVAYFEDHNLPLPESLADLAESEYGGLLVVQNPATSSPGLAFLLATIAEFGDEDDEDGYDYLDYWIDLVDNDVLVVDGWTEAYYTYFSAPGRPDGDRPLVLSYASSPPVEFFFSDPAPESAVTGAIVADNTCFRQIEFVGILQGAEHLEAAQAFVDFTLNLTFQEDLPLQMYVFPVRPDAELPDVFVEYAAVPDVTAGISYEDIEANREEWIQAWTETVLR